MSDPVRIPPPLEALVRAVSGGTSDADREQRASTFARGLALGALVGAAIAGSTIWQRRLAKSRESDGAPASETPPDGGSKSG